MPVRTLRRFATGMILCLSLAAIELPARSQQPSPRKLNVLFIAVDDLNNNLGCYGHPAVKSPNIDRLAARGVRFDRAYCQYPLCNPSRTSLLSGRRPEATQVFTNNTPPRTHLKDVVMLPEYFHQNGYFTARVGKIAHAAFEDAVKWDVSENADRRRERQMLGWLNLPPGQRPDEKPFTDWRATGNKDEEEADGGTARRIVQLLEAHAKTNAGKPFFIAAGFHRPHTPWMAPKKYFDLYPPGKIRLPREPADDRKDIPPSALTRAPGADELTEAQRREVIAAYYACVSFMDAQVGVVLDALDRLKLTDNTLIVLFGDHGYHLGEHGGLWHKMSLFEESARVPLIVAAPGKRAGAHSPRLVELVDLYPTLAEACGLPAPEQMEGTSFVPLLADPQRAWKRAAFIIVNQGRNRRGRSVHTERYRYTEWGDAQGAELYDHQTDPREYTNLAADPKQAKTLAEMKRLLQEGWRAATPRKKG